MRKISKLGRSIICAYLVWFLFMSALVFWGVGLVSSLFISVPVVAVVFGLRHAMPSQRYVDRSQSHQMMSPESGRAGFGSMSAQG